GDRVGGVFALSVTDGSELWTGDDPAKVDAIATDGEALYLGRGTQVLRVDAESGDTVWSTNVSTGLDDLLVVGDRVAVQTWRDLVGLEPKGGTIVWSAPGATDIATDGAVLIAHDGRTVRLVDADGSDAATWPVEAESLGASRYLTTGPDGVWLVDTVTDTVRLGP
ncbi:MAG: PQQ-binding-like beta-propeller repeat protein, partial [Microbacterium sp.]